MDDDTVNEALIAKAASELARLVTWARAERVVCGDHNEHAAWLDEMLDGLEPLAADLHDVQTSIAIRRVVQQLGGGCPRSVEDLAAMTGRDASSVERVLAGFAEAGLAWPPDPDDDSS
ncbi:hypothetical protein [Mycolicibacterium fortuitum]|uniref:hypothetical protein n=1 Tax=Mycolicibacterium fortuitum TaxID=1766 RepID=UPI00148FE26B|nr:hypothetical protein [Mycolicibacterium fortuitum]